MLIANSGGGYMQNKDLAPEDDEKTITVSMPREKPSDKRKTENSPHVVTAESVQAEEVPTIPLESLRTLSTLEPAVSVRSVEATRSVRLPAPLVNHPSEYRRSLGEWLQVWWEGTRPGYLPLAIMPVLVGSTLAWAQSVSPGTPLGNFHLFPFIFALFAVVALEP